MLSLKLQIVYPLCILGKCFILNTIWLIFMKLLSWVLLIKFDIYKMGDRFCYKSSNKLIPNTTDIVEYWFLFWSALIKDMIGYNTGLVSFFFVVVFFIHSLICTILSSNMFSLIIEHCYSNGEKKIQPVDLFIFYRKSDVLYSHRSFLSLYLVSLLNFNFFQH